jgi:hypothetical protein
MQDTILRATVRTHTTATDVADRIRAGLAERLDIRDERGDVTPRTVGIAVMTAAAVAVGAAITLKIINKESTITLD